MVGGAAGCRLFDRDSAWAGRDRFHRGPLSPDHAIGERGIVAQLCFAEPSKDRSAHRRRRVTDERAYYWLSLTLVSFVTAGLREELWRAATLAGMRALWPGAFMSRTGESIAIALIGVAFGAAHLSMGALAAVGAGLIGIFLGIILIIHRSFGRRSLPTAYSTQPLLRCCRSSQTSSRSCLPRRTYGVRSGAFCSLSGSA